MKKIKNKCHLFVWGAFFIYLMIQHSLVWMSIDDYGYASLNYVVNVGTSGNNYTFVDILKYLYEHYMQWGGRILFYGIAIVVYHYGGLVGMRIFQSIILFLIFYFMFWVISKSMNEMDKLILSIIVCLLYGVFQIDVANYGLYWFSASSGYVWPILFVFWASYSLYILIINNEDKLSKWIKCSFLWFVSAFSQEQIAIASLVMCFMLILYGRKGNRTLYLIIPFVATISGSLIMLLAPGNFGRLEDTSEMGLFNQMSYNIPFLFEYIFSACTKIFLISVFICFLLVTDNLIRNNNKMTIHVMLKIIFFLQLVTVFLMLVFDVSFANFSVLIKMAVTALILVSIILVIYYLIIQNKIWHFCCLVGAITCYGAMAIVPAIPIRIYIPFIFLLLPTIVLVFKENLRNVQTFILIVPLSMLLICNSLDIYSGYKLNHSLQKANWEAISNYHEEKNNNIELTKMYSDLYTGPLSYMEAYGWADQLICKYFDLPEGQVKFSWKESYYIESTHVYDMGEEFVFSIVPSLYMGNEMIFVNGELVSATYGDSFITFSLEKSAIQTKSITITMHCPSYQLNPVKTVISIS